MISVSWKPLLLVVIAALTTVAQAEIFRWVDESGRVHFTDRPPWGEEAEQVTVRVNTYASPEVSKLEAVIDETGEKVVMYSASWCGVCKKAKTYFQRKGIPFVEYDVEKSAKGKQDFKKLGGKGVPVILVGETRLNGFSRAAFERAYRQ